jgi:hypothetical protein
MRKWMLLLAAIVLVPAQLGLAQSREEMRLRAIAAENESRLVEVNNLERETARAMQWNTGTFFRRVYSDDFQGILPSGQILDKAGWIASIERSDIKYSSFVASDIRVKMFEATAVVTCLWSARGNRNGRDFAKQSRVTHVYVYGVGGWEAVASQETLLPGTENRNP